MIIGPKYKICKRLGSSVFEKCQTQKYQLAEARAPRKQSRGRRGGSDFGAQLLEKQKARFTYGLSESQFARYVHEAMDSRATSSAAGLINRLESRLDNVVYRAGITATRRMARQLVSHGHVMVNGKRTTVPSHKVVAGDTISIRQESRGSALFANRAEAAVEAKAPSWLRFEDQGFAVAIASEPTVEETSAPFNVGTVIQFYSR